MQERKAELAGKRLLEISPTSNSKKDAKENKNKKQTTSTSENSEESGKGVDAMLEDKEVGTVNEQEILELSSSDSKSERRKEWAKKYKQLQRNPKRS